MASPTTTCQAIVLRTVPYGEADLVVHLLCRGRGKLGAFARGARKSTRRFGGGVEPFTLLDVELAERRGGDLLDFKGAQIIEPHLSLRTDLNRLAHAGYATELCRELLRENEPHDELFELLLSFFSTLSQAGARSLSLRAFELAALGAAGFAPQLDQCARCGSDPESVSELWFSANVGGVICVACAGAGAFRIDRLTWKSLLGLQRGGLALAERANAGQLPLEIVRRVLKAFIDRHVHHDLRSRAFIEEVGAPA